MVDQREGLASDDLRYVNGGSRGTEYWWADYTCRIQNEISNHLQNLYKNFRFMAFWRSYHTYTSMHGPASPVGRLLVVIKILPVLAGGWWRHQHPPKEPANNDLAFFISFLPIVDICFFRSRRRSRPKQSHPSKVGGAGGVAGYCWKSPMRTAIH